MELGSQSNPLRVAIVGSGPSGFYAAEALFLAPLVVDVDMIERLPAPFGLVRHGVAPDHPRLKQPTQVYDAIARSPRFRYFGNVQVGRDVSIEELLATHHAVLLACGAETDRRLEIPGEDLPGSHTATAFVGWYNGHPDYSDRRFDLTNEVAVIIGQGNVAADVARILLKPVDALRGTDIAQHALDELAGSRVREVHIVGRRGPAQAKFTTKELRELGELPGCKTEIADDQLQLGAACLAELAEKNNSGAAKNVELFRSWGAQRTSVGDHRIVFHFLRSPVEFLGTRQLEHVVLERNALAGEPFGQAARGTGQNSSLDCGLVFRSIGYRGLPLAGVPFDAAKGVFPHVGGRVLGADGLYAAGWVKRGPSGIIGTNRADSFETVKTLLDDRPRLDQGPKGGGDALQALLAQRLIRVVGYDDWLKVDALELHRGSLVGKPREKFVRVEQMLAAIAPAGDAGVPVGPAASMGHGRL